MATWGATNASTVTYLTPVVGVTLGVLILSEGLDWNQSAGAHIVILGIALSQDRLRPLTTMWPRPKASRRTNDDYVI